ncbi:hypothetical protein D9M71_655340 [compost metagenome]
MKIVRLTDGGRWQRGCHLRSHTHLEVNAPRFLAGLATNSEKGIKHITAIEASDELGIQTDGKAFRLHELRLVNDLDRVVLRGTIDLTPEP